MGISRHAAERSKERYRVSRADIRRALMIAKENGTFHVVQAKEADRVIVFFSENRRFLYKAVLSKITGDVITSLPVHMWDKAFAEAKGIIAEGNRTKQRESGGVE